MKIGSRNFGRDRRYPITNGYRDDVTVTVRFAPSPTGRLHVGNARAAVLNWLFARQSGGRFVLRLDDTDRERSTEDFARGIETDFAWLDLNHDLFVRQLRPFRALHRSRGETEGSRPPLSRL